MLFERGIQSMGKIRSRKKGKTTEPQGEKQSVSWLPGSSLFIFFVLSSLLVSWSVAVKQAPAQEIQGEMIPEVESSVAEEKELFEQMVKEVVVEHAPKSAEEELVYDFVDWVLHIFSSVAGELGVTLETDKNYFITQTGESYEVRLDPFLIHFDEGVLLNFAPMVFTCRPQGKDKLGIEMFFPRKLPVLNNGKPTAEITIASQQISGVWDRGMEFFDHGDLKLGEVVLRDIGSNARFSVQQIALNSRISHDAKGLWQAKYQGMLQGVSLTDDDLNLRMDSLKLSSELRGNNYKTYGDIQKKYFRVADNLAEMELSELRDIMAMADTYLQLLISSESKVSIEGVVVEAGDRIQLDGLEFSGLLEKDLQSNTFKMDGKGDVLGLSFVEQADESNPRPLSVNLQQIKITDNVQFNPIPQTLFADMGRILEQVGLLEDEEAVDNYLADEGLKFTRKILKLIAGGSMEIDLSDAIVSNVMEQPVTLGAVKLGGGFSAGNGTGGKVNVLAGFSGLAGLGQGNTTIPQAARLNVTLDHIPSLLELISDPGSLAEGDMDQVQGQVMMNGVSAFLTSPLRLSLTDSFVLFPTSRLNLELTANMDSAAQYLSTGSMKMVMENPDEFMQIAKAFGADEDMQQLLTMLTALSNRSNENGKVVDRLNAEVNGEGKVFANNKDITLMFFPEQAETNEESETDSEEALAPTESE